VLSAWSTWSECDAVCDGSPIATGEQEQTRTVLVQPENDGAACGELSRTQPCVITCTTTTTTTTTTTPAPTTTSLAAVDCVLGGWTEWSECDALCDGSSPIAIGEEERTRSILVPPSNGGLACQSTRMTQSCTIVCATTSTTGSTLDFCESDDDFRDIDGYSCDQYERYKWCSPNEVGGFGKYWDKKWGDIDDWGNVRAACCACRGPDYTTTTTAVTSTQDTTSSTTTQPQCPATEWTKMEGDKCHPKRDHDKCCSGACLDKIKKCAPVNYCVLAGQKKFRLEGKKCKKDSECCSNNCHNKKCTAPPGAFQEASGGLQFSMSEEAQKSAAWVARANVASDMEESDAEETSSSSTQLIAGMAAVAVAAVVMVGMVAVRHQRRRRRSTVHAIDGTEPELDMIEDGLGGLASPVKRKNPLFDLLDSSKYIATA